MRSAPLCCEAVRDLLGCGMEGWGGDRIYPLVCEITCFIRGVELGLLCLSLCCLLSPVPAVCLGFPSAGAAPTQRQWSRGAGVIQHLSWCVGQAWGPALHPTAPVPPSRCRWGWGHAAPPVSPTGYSHRGQVAGVGLGLRDDAVACDSISGGGLEPAHPNRGGGGIRTTPPMSVSAPSISRLEDFQTSRWRCAITRYRTGNVYPAFAHLTPKPGRDAWRLLISQPPSPPGQWGFGAAQHPEGGSREEVVGSFLSLAGR